MADEERVIRHPNRELRENKNQEDDEQVDDDRQQHAFAGGQCAWHPLDIRVSVLEIEVHQWFSNYNIPDIYAPGCRLPFGHVEVTFTRNNKQKLPYPGDTCSRAGGSSTSIAWPALISNQDGISPRTKTEPISMSQ